MTRKRTPEEIRACIRRLWGTLAVSDIASRVHLSASRVRAIAADMGLPPPKSAANGVHGHNGRRPYTPEEIAWAKENPAHPEAPLIIGMAGGVK